MSRLIYVQFLLTVLIHGRHCLYLLYSRFEQIFNSFIINHLIWLWFLRFSILFHGQWYFILNQHSCQSASDSHFPWTCRWLFLLHERLARTFYIVSILMVIHWIGIMLTGLMLVIWHNCIMLECRERVWETFWALKWHRSLFVSWESCFVLSSWRLGFVFGGWKIFVDISTFLASSRELSTRESILYHAFAFN